MKFEELVDRDLTFHNFALGHTGNIASNVLHKAEENPRAHFITVERSFGCRRRGEKISRTLTFRAARTADQMGPNISRSFDFSIEFSSRRVRQCQRNFRLLANRRGIILSGIFLPGVSRRHRRRRYRGTVTIVDVKVTREGGRKREAERRGEERRGGAREWDRRGKRNRKRRRNSTRG